MPFPDIAPEIFSIEMFGLTLALRWYAVAYIAGLLLGWALVRRLMARPMSWPGGVAPLSKTDVDDLLTYMILGVVIGGRLGFTLFYQPGYYLSHPLEILRVWQGGMSFHGGFLGVIVGICLFCRVRAKPLLSVGDAVAIAAPIGIFFGRLANFINAELWGRPSTLPWAVAFPGERAQACGPEWPALCTRHPSQLYEAVLEGLLLFAIMMIGLRLGWLKSPGRIIGVFFLGYGLARTFVELFREADAQYVTADNPLGHVLQLGGFGLSMGQALSLPMILIGLIFLMRRRSQP